MFVNSYWMPDEPTRGQRIMLRKYPDWDIDDRILGSLGGGSLLMLASVIIFGVILGIPGAVMNVLLIVGLPFLVAAMAVNGYASLGDAARRYRKKHLINHHDDYGLHALYSATGGDTDIMDRHPEPVNTYLGDPLLRKACEQLDACAGAEARKELREAIRLQAEATAKELIGCDEAHKQTLRDAEHQRELDAQSELEHAQAVARDLREQAEGRLAIGTGDEDVAA